MRKTTKVLAMTVLFAGGSMHAFAQQDPRAVPVFNSSHDIGAILETAQAKGKALTLVLRNGKIYTGEVKSVAAHAVILTGLQGKEFFDAWIRLDEIAAMEERVRIR